MPDEREKISFGVLILSIVTLADSYRILGIFPLNFKSHFIVFEAVMEGLVKHGHQVDVISQFPRESTLTNYNDIMSFEGTMMPVVNNVTLDSVLESSNLRTFHTVQFLGNHLCDFMGFDKMQQLIKNPPTNPPYDLVITEAFAAHCYMGFGYIFKVPVVAISAVLEYPWVSYFTGNDDNLAYVRNSLFTGTGQMSFPGRLKNFIMYYWEIWEFHWATEKSQTESMRQYLRPDIPNIREVEKNVALTLVNTHPVLSGIKPLTPGVVQIGGIHIETNNLTLPEELKNWMDESVHGVVYFSFGSMILIESFPQNQIKDMYASFAKITPVRILMKVVNTSNLPQGLPPNVKTLPWIPQQAVLAHPNTKVFITHGGLGGVQEALYFAVPMIGIPMIADQFWNVQTFVEKQMMIKINFQNITEKSLDSALNVLLHNYTYKEKAMHYSKLFKDRPMSPMKTAVYWIEYVIRNGDSVLRSPALQLSFIQLSQLDIYGPIFIIIFIHICILLVGIRLFIIATLEKLYSKPTTKKTD